MAKEVDGLLEISVPVTDQSDRKRHAAARKALLEIIIRISGQSTASTNSVVQSNLKKASAHIQRYLYHEIDVIDDEGNSGKQLMLDLFFDEISLRGLLSDAKLPRWGANRPQLLLWVAVGNQQKRFLLGTDDESLFPEINNPEISRQSSEDISRQSDEVNLREILSTRAGARGLPVLFPLMDLEDLIAIDVADVWGRFILPIREASLRYEQDAILATQIIFVDGVWQSHWLLLHKDSVYSWEHESSSIENALNTGIDLSTDQLALLYAVAENSLQQNQLLISVSNINSLQDYAYLIDYIENLTAVESVGVANINGSTIQLRINLIGEQEAMLQVISLNNQLVIESMPSFNRDGIIGQLPTLFFRWNLDER